MNEDDLTSVMLAGIRDALRKRYVLELLKSDKHKSLNKEINFRELNAMVEEITDEFFGED